MNDVVGNDAIKQIAGKRIRNVSFNQTQDGVNNRLIILFTDFSGFILQFGQADTMCLFGYITSDNFSNNWRDKSFQTICSESMDPDGSEKERVNKLFHTLWSKSGNYKYDKEEWKALGSILDESGY